MPNSKEDLSLASTFSRPPGIVTAREGPRHHLPSVRRSYLQLLQGGPQESTYINIAISIHVQTLEYQQDGTDHDKHSTNIKSASRSLVSQFQTHPHPPQPTMAELAAGALVAEQVVSTTVEGGVIAGYAVAKPTMPLKASLSQLTCTAKETSSDLARSHHSVTIIGSRAYIFGGQDAEGKLVSPDVQSIALPKSSLVEAEFVGYAAAAIEDGSELPGPRMRHAACARGKHVVVSGGCDGEGNVLAELSCFWLWDTKREAWAQVKDDRYVSVL